MSRLERWSRLKRNGPQEQEAPPVAEPVGELAAKSEHAPDGEQKVSEQAAAEQSPLEHSPLDAEPKPGSLDHTLPDPETLEAGSDFSAFMVPGVSGALRRRALKRLWATGNYNVRDGLDDYDADYNQLLKPMDSELASKLRRWTHKVEEAVDKSLEEPLDEPLEEPLEESESTKALAKNQQTNEHSVALESDSSASHGEGANAIENTLLDDQSDYLSSAKTKT